VALADVKKIGKTAKTAAATPENLRHWPADRRRCAVGRKALKKAAK
jgi:hypothetical protein